MGHRIVEIGSSAFLRKNLDRLEIRRQGEVLDTIPIEDLAVVLLDGDGIALTADLLAAFAQAGVLCAVSDDRHLPCALCLPYESNARHAQTVQQQAACSLPKRKGIWRQIVRAKIREQANALEVRGHARGAAKLREMMTRVRSGDPDNLEAQAALIYFDLFFGRDFYRDRTELGVNAMLNYGYAIIRGMVARALVGAGLHPALGVHHCGPYNPFNLADDAMEPLRPVADLVVADVSERFPDAKELTPEIKRELLTITVLSVTFAGISLPILTALERYSAILREAICGERRKVETPSLSR
ncbi:MAG: CRISPR-associated endonuclease Cas1 [Nitrospiraceae bacterium]|nr:MAG: CRISPR-associated endonuclease Cas1 [Nitrospiraceae bacterium]